MIPFCGYYICWYDNLWDISFTMVVDWDQLLLCIEPHSCLMHQFLLDNSSMMYNLHKGSSGYSKKLSTETLITHKFIHQFMSCLLSHPSSFGSFSRSIHFLRKQHYMHPFNKLPVLCLTDFEGEQHRQLDLWTDGHSLFWMDNYCHQMKINNKKSMVEHRSCYSRAASK